MSRTASESHEWPCGPTDRDRWEGSAATASILGESKGPVSADWIHQCLIRAHQMRNELRTAFCGLHSEELGDYLDWLLSAMIARENILLLGPPGVAKTEIAVHAFDLLGLKPPRRDNASLPDEFAGKTPRQWWDERETRERRTSKYFHCLLGRFTQPEELFGPVEISLLKRGVLVRVNFGFLTGAGVYAAFLDEIFKASTSILNTLLTLCQERTYFNWGGMERSDLAILIGASNEMPGILSGASRGISGMEEDFQNLYAFIDRFSTRLNIPLASGLQRSAGPRARPSEIRENRTLEDVGPGSDLGEAARIAIDREGRAFLEGHGNRFETRHTPTMPCLNDLLLLGRACMQHTLDPEAGLFDRADIDRFTEALLYCMADLQRDGKATNIGKGRITWSISPRKVKALYKIGLAHALVCDDSFVADEGRTQVTLGPRDLRMMDLIWDSPVAMAELSRTNSVNLRRFWKT